VLGAERVLVVAVARVVEVAEAEAAEVMGAAKATAAVVAVNMISKMVYTSLSTSTCRACVFCSSPFQMTALPQVTRVPFYRGVEIMLQSSLLCNSHWYLDSASLF
jgi:hypothetical protein